MTQGVIDKHVTRDCVVALIASHAGDDLGAGKMLRCPSYLLFLGPAAPWAACENDRVQMTDRSEQLPCIRS